MNDCVTNGAIVQQFLEGLGNGLFSFAVVVSLLWFLDRKTSAINNSANKKSE